jgi:hypothetical protein
VSLTLLTANTSEGGFFVKNIDVVVKEMISLNLDDLNDFQGDLKYIEDENLEKLIRNIEKVGFCDSFAVWKSDDKWFILNGHQRRLALMQMQLRGYQIPKLPAVVINADSYDHARKILLSIESKYGRLNSDTLSNWTSELDELVDSTLRFVDKELKLDIDLGIDTDRVHEDPEEESNNSVKLHVCPSCGHEFK